MPDLEYLMNKYSMIKQFRVHQTTTASATEVFQHTLYDTLTNLYPFIGRHCDFHIQNDYLLSNAILKHDVKNFSTEKRYVQIISSFLANFRCLNLLNTFFYSKRVYCKPTYSHSN